MVEGGRHADPHSTNVYLTIDTEYSGALFGTLGVGGRAENFARSILGRTPQGEAGIRYQMDVLDRHGLKAVFFVDPMPALVWGTEAIADVVRPIVERGHEVQLHLHTEWLAFARGKAPITRTGHDMRDFTRAEQQQLIRWGIDTLIEAGAPRPTAFRAGNYGANDDTLAALADAGIGIDTSHCPGIARSKCEISLTQSHLVPTLHCGVVEVPINAIRMSRNTLRHVQLTALSHAELVAALRFAVSTRAQCFTIITHSFELLSRDRLRINRIVQRRFEALCRSIAETPGCRTETYVSAPPFAEPPERIATPSPLLPHSPVRTGLRMAEQFVANGVWGR
jgi:hypothetical protein